MSPNQRKGRIAELKVALHLVEKGWDVEWPTGKTRVDLIAFKPDTGTILVQVKTMPKSGGVRMASVGPLGGQTGGYVREYRRGDFDWLAVVDGDDLFIAPYESIEGKYASREGLAFWKANK